MLNTANLHEMSQVDIEKIHRNTLVDIKTVKIDTSRSIEKRMIMYLAQIKNPYCFLCGETPVKIRFSDIGKPLDTAVKSHFIGLKTL